MLHIKFVVAYYYWIKKQPTKTDKTHFTRAELQTITFRQALVRFNRMLRMIGLDPADYAHLVKRNMLPRWENGRKRI